MCGIFGLISKKVDQDKTIRDIHKLFKLSESRGKEAAGIALCTQKKISIYKDALSASEMLQTKEYQDFINHETSNIVDHLALIGHARLVTNGFQAIGLNNQPVNKNGIVIVHNGIIVNDEVLWQQHPSLVRNAQVDTEIIPAILNELLEKGHSLSDALHKTFDQLKGEISVGILLDKLDVMVLYSNTGSLFTIVSDEAMAFVSEKSMAEKTINGKYQLENFHNQPCVIEQIKPNEIVIFELQTLKKSILKSSYDTINIAPLLMTQKVIEDNFEKLEEKRKKLKRCTKCILPETMPFIEFDSEGVCNYCRTYKPKVLLGKEKLEEELSKYRSKNGSADCLVAFSGGRDSSYGLHLLKKEYGMTPIAYTYDWGMVTDIARRNQARMCGQLGVEHLWVSANIKQKRLNIHKNVKAWLKKPDLGMVPLFMAGDKQFFWYANKMMQETGIKLMVFSMNHFEKTNFKTGFAGRSPDSGSGGKYYDMSLKNKFSLPLYYAKNFISNPSYINTTIVDTLFAYASFYFIKQDYLYLFDYLEWNEDRLNQVLLSEYEWEIAKDTASTWRIGDGTAPFYNYIYYTIAGFSENDTFRSNQIREGHLTREDALILSAKENLPRWDSIREYLNMINVPFDDAIRVVDKMKKLY